MGNICCMRQKDVEENKYGDKMQYLPSAAKAVTHAQVAVELVLRSKKPSGFEFDINQDDSVRITGMTIINNDRLVICNNKSSHLLVYSTSGKYLHQEPVSGYPFDIAVLSLRNQAVVSFQWKNYIQVINLSNPRIIAARTIDLTYQASGGIASFQNKFFVGRERGYTVNRFEGDHLQLIAHVEIVAQNIHVLKYTPACVAYSDSKHLYIVLKGIGYVQSSKEQAARPNGIAFHDSGSVYCTDYVNDCVVKYMKIDNEWTVILTKDDGLYAPRAICFNDDYSKLCIANNDGQSIYVYTV